MKKMLGWLANTKKKRAYKVLSRNRRNQTLRLASAITPGLVFTTLESNIDFYGYRWCRRKPAWLNRTRFHGNQAPLIH